jgi:hypothetical protein
VKQPEYIKLWALLAQAEALLHHKRPESAQAVLRRAEARFNAGNQASRRIFGRLRLFQGIAAQALGQHETALTLMQAGAAEYIQLLGADHPLTLLVTAHQARALWLTHQGDKALALLSHAMPILQEALGPQAPTFRKLQALHAELAQATAMSFPTSRKVDIFL